MAGREIPMGLTPASINRRAFTILEPIGIVGAISAFNHPLNLIVHQVVPAIAVGCPVIVKPALTTPLSCIDFVALLHEAGLPAGWCQVFLPETDELAETFATDPRIAFLSFIGSSRVGWYLRSKLPPGTRCALERWSSSSDHRPQCRP
jgi:acyl-CoA reductase-like NAD-dependent aldehyde dehydrogenase